MVTCTNQAILLVQGIQFSVLARAFPVLRHDALRPIANAKMAAAMMQRGVDEAMVYSDSRNQQLLSDVDFMLDEAVESVRQLADWLTDSGRTVNVEVLVQECAKLLFTELLLSGKKVILADFDPMPRVPEHNGRYIVLAWLLYLIELAPDGSALTISAEDACLDAHLDAEGGGAIIRRSALNTLPLLTLTAVQTLAAHYGWRAGGTNGVWQLMWPTPSSHQCKAVNRVA